MSNGISPTGGKQPPDGTKGVIFKIVGFQEQLNAPMLIAIRQWEPAAPSHPGNWTHLGTHVYHRHNENMFGSSTLSLHKIEELFGETTIAITLGPTLHVKVTNALRKMVVIARESLAPTLPITNHSSSSN